MVTCLVPLRSRKSVSAAIATHRTAAARLRECVTYGTGGRAEADAALIAEAAALKGVAVAHHGRKASFALQMKYLTALSRRDPRSLEYLRAVRTAAKLWLRDRERSEDSYK